VGLPYHFTVELVKIIISFSPCHLSKSDLSYCRLLLLVAEHLLLLMMIGSNSRVANSNLSVRMGHQEQSIAGHEQWLSGWQLLVGERRQLREPPFVQ
jgi:hypothetical protein